MVVVRSGRCFLRSGRAGHGVQRFVVGLSQALILEWSAKSWYVAVLVGCDKTWYGTFYFNWIVLE